MLISEKDGYEPLLSLTKTQTSLLLRCLKKQTDQSQSLLARRHSPSGKAPNPGLQHHPTHLPRQEDERRGRRGGGGGGRLLQEAAADPRAGGRRKGRVGELSLHRRLSAAPPLRLPPALRLQSVLKMSSTL